MNGVGDPETDDPDFVEVDPTGRYGRYNEILGKGASKTVYRAFDEYEGIEVAWNQVKLCDFLHNPEDLERLYCEIHLLKTLKHDNIMKFYASWVDTANRNINFVTEMFTSGTLRQYRLKHRRVNIRAVKHWCRQILSGLLYLHSHDPPVIHRDLKCDNIFVNGHQGEVKIGDLGLAAILRKSHAARCVGTPEFMAPEIYEEEYNELVDIYSFGMCILEMVTFEYPYSECTHPAQIYKKVVSGKMPDALYKVKDPEVLQFVEKCLATASRRLSAEELLMDPFLQMDHYGSEFRALDYWGDFNEVGPFLGAHRSGSPSVNGYSNYPSTEHENGMYYNSLDYETRDIDLFTCHEDEHLANVDISIRGKRREDDGIFLRLRIADEEGRIRNIYFPFDIETDTPLTVAAEMVAELDITDQDVTKIAEMIDGEIAALVPEWEKGLGIDESSNCSNANYCHNCAPSRPNVDYVSSPSARNLQVRPCSRNGCTAVHGRFEEVTYQVEGSEQSVTGGAPNELIQSDGLHYADIWAQRDEQELSTSGCEDAHSDAADAPLKQPSFEQDERVIVVENTGHSDKRNPISVDPSSCSFTDDYDNAIRQELRWLKAKYQLQLRELRDQQLGVKSKSYSAAENSNGSEHKEDINSLRFTSATADNNELILKSLASVNSLTSCFRKNDEQTFPSASNQWLQSYETATGPCGSKQMFARSFSSGALLPQSLHRATSLPVDAVDCQKLRDHSLAV